MTAETCTHENCHKPVLCRGLCRTHYRSPNQRKQCAIDGCANNRWRGEHCGAHYSRPNQLKQCTVDGCDNNRWKGEHCGAHYVSPNQRKQCIVNGCDNNRWKGEHCRTHYQRLYHHGTVEPPEINQRETHGYIIRDHNNQPIYIGITCNFHSRMQTHIDTQPWAPYAKIPEQPTVTFPTREQAEQWEKQTIEQTIATGGQLFNQTHNHHWSENYENNLLASTIDTHDHKLMTIGANTQHG